MQESLIHYLWSLQYFDRSSLLTTGGEPIVLFHPGMLNTHAGPDFSNARLSIGDIKWVGNVEIHIKSSGWFEHHHDVDPAYDTVILHVVWQEDKEILRRDGTRLPTLELRGRVHDDLIRSYRQLISSAFTIPCKRTFPAVDMLLKQSMISKALVHRLERKAEDVLTLLALNGNDWEETTYQLIARAFGFKVNADPFLQLAKSIPLKLLRKQQQLTQVEALLFGQAGFLESTKGDEYYLMLRREHHVLAHKYRLSDGRLNKSQWHFLRLRPPNFPSLRIAQLSAFIHHQQNVFSRFLAAQDASELLKLFRFSPSPYWHEHFQFTKKSANRIHELGKGSAEGIIINTVVPILVAYGRRTDDQPCVDRALGLLEQLPPEENSIVGRWSDLGMVAQNSFDAQGLIELFNTFCTRKNCLQCTIGASIIRPPVDEPDHTVS
ncbi:MAG: DUF2851 family protein [Cyclobacteriaceae bacterium]|nr:DUF2851 family protein [Cyclobacteriaceae bacterium]